MTAGFYRRWIVANGWAEALGLGTTFVLGRLAAPWLEASSGVAPVVLTAVLAVVLGVALEGWLVGTAQASVLCERLQHMSRRAWTLATMVGAGLAWTIGMIPSTVMALVELTGTVPVKPESPPAEPGPLLVYPAAVVLGAVTGPILGAAQWVALKRHVPRAHRWLWANAAAWAVGMPAIFLGMDHVPWTGGIAEVTLAVYAVCGAAGLLVGAVHGRVLDTLTRGVQ